MVGLIRTIGDGCYILYIQDIVVHPDYQRKGIGTKLIKKVLEQSEGMCQIILTTDNREKTKQLYASAGFTPTEETVPFHSSN